jgi:phosphoglycerate dehydrogenase-like enzyme
MRAVAIQTEELDDAASSWLAERVDLKRCAPDEPGFADLLAIADALVVRTYTIVNDAMLDRAPKLRVVGRAGVGLDNIDLAACERRAVRVVHTPDANTQAVVELVAAFALDALRPRVFLDKALPLNEWKRVRNDLIAPKQLGDLTVGVLGFGRIGKGAARVFESFGSRVIYHDIEEVSPVSRLGAEPVSRDDLFRLADILTIHVDERAENRNLITSRELGAMKHNAILINTSRGFVVNTPDLASWLRANPGAQAILDVHEPEPFTSDCPLLGLPNAHLAPHIGAATARAKQNMSWVVKDVWRVICGEHPEHAAV